MTALWQPGTTVVRRLRVKGSSQDSTLTQLRVTNMLNMVDLHPRGLPPAAIVCIRTLRDPLPGVLQLQQGGVHPPRVWEHAVVASLEQLVRDAAYPIRGMVPANANAVIFADQAEVLACLAIDWCEGTLGVRWWWQSLFKGIGTMHTVLPTWLDSPEYIPAALQHLAERKNVVPFVRGLNPGDARVLLQSVTRSFALYKLQVALDDGIHRPNTFVDEAFDLKTGQPLEPRLPATLYSNSMERPPLVDAGSPQPRHLQKGGWSPPLSIPWQRWVPENEAAALHLEQQCLLGVGLMLQRAPTIVRTASFAHTVLQWRRAEQTLSADGISNVEVGLMKTGEPRQPRLERSSDIQTDKIEAQQTSTIDEHNRHVELAGAGQTQLYEHDKHVELADAGQAQLTVDTATPQLLSDTLVSPEPGTKERNSNQQQPLSTPVPPSPAIRLQSDTQRMHQAQIETAYGGIFYLINLGLFLHFYSDFTSPVQSGLTLDLWDFVALLGQQLLGEKILADPVWSLLAHLAGRDEHDSPGSNFDLPQEWRVPVAWCKPFPGEGMWQWSAEGERLQVQHPEQFLLLDVPLDDGDPMEQLRREMQVYGDVGVVPVNSLGDHKGTPWLGLERWLGWLMPYVRACLHRALGLTKTDDLIPIFCEHHAHVFVTAAHLDIVLSLAELPIEIRIAGLDRDPGWVPAAGRFIAFHFE